ncbi:hypothetical protein CYMTET_4384, partial [Cymbomonas tetramitiformis]
MENTIVEKARSYLQGSKELRQEGRRSLREFIFEQDRGDLLAVVEKGDPCEFLRAVFSTLEPLPFEANEDNVACKKLRLELIHRVLKILGESQLSERRANSWIEILLRELDSISVARLPTVVESILEQFQANAGEGRALELLPKCLALIDASSSYVFLPSDDIEHLDEDAVTMTPAEYRGKALSCLCSIEWPLPLVALLLKVIRDAPMTTAQLEQVVMTALKRSRKLDLQELPAVAYQLLLLSKLGLKRLIIQGIVELFEWLEDRWKHREGSKQAGHDQLRHIQGTIMLHINFAAKQDPELGQ